ncbi:MAG TPA: prepilin-type N-terminal cleavage/methylation domain-containing protein [Candidatus Pristimantibacillus sp.]|nr:prepilin-type N-terminal cleavage/methylation domain-containing protein [Candidatus Pristimantibacillus sp.]
MKSDSETGFTLVELTVTMVVLSVIVLAFMGLFTSLVRSTVVAKRQAVALSLATNEMEYIKSLSYDNLAVAGGSIFAANPLPAVTTKKVNGVTYTITISINYVDDAYDGCANYPSQQLKQLYCRHYPPPAGSPNPDPNPQDYKIIHVQVTDAAGTRLAQADTQISSRVAETASTTGALFVTVLDQNGDPLAGATVTVANSSLAPTVNLSDGTDSNGIAIFYGLPPDTSGYHYTIGASKLGYSSLNTIAPFGALQPTYSNQNIFAQQSSYVTLTLKRMTGNSFIIETVDTSGNPLPNVKVYIKGGYKKYTDTADTTYYYDNMTPSDNRITTDASGFAVVQNLVPGAYIFCGDDGSDNCNVGAITYYAAAALPYGGSNPLNPIVLPSDPASPANSTFDFGGVGYLQKVRLIMTSSVNVPRAVTLEPYDASLSSPTISNFPFTLTGNSMPCGGTPASCNTTLTFTQGANSFPASCTGQSGNDKLSCTVDLSGASQGVLQMVVTATGRTLSTPASPPMGGLIIEP